MSYLRNQPYDEKDFPAFKAMKDEFGFVPNFFPQQITRPDLIETEVAMTSNILLKEGALPRRQKEYIFLVCSAANLSTYCVTAHCEIIRMLKLEGPEPEQIAIDYVHSKISVADKALLNYCSKLNSQPTKIGPDDVERLRTYGFTEQQILEAVLVVGWSRFANVVAFGLGTVPDFHNTKINQVFSERDKAEQEVPVVSAP